MVIEKPVRRMTLRQQLTHAEKCSRDLAEHVQGSLLPSIADIRDLSRPVRRRSHYPTMVSVLNSLKKIQQTGAQTVEKLDYLQEQLQEIREHARRERVNRR
jgi:aminoglycoside phosphotransferase (APT) family kinase protein